MNILLEILQYVGPFIGVLIGWFLSQRSEKKKIQYDERKKVNHTLFLLLEIRNELTNILKDDKFLRTYIDKVKEKLNVAEPTAEENTLLKGFMLNLKNTMKSDNQTDNLESQFLSCVRNLSEINPILAYRISGKQDLRKFIENWENQSKEVLSLEDFNQTEQMLEHFKPKVINELEKDLNDIIINVAKLTENEQVIEDTTELIHRKSDGEFEKEITELVERLFDADGIKTIANGNRCTTP
ncbi:hypothetical protein [Olleya sp. Bg11-27]|uniref:hypothetical protein n=1 Tax=Olleya sp. Bg11-27 TaxID=2058135 RepID=UPI000C2FFCB5|nr:hypothetical protein [Olleya sp. Bg11-27]AUC77247.1 hypothetical protein CW732_16815 [Olleya sp. Bg11-27]